MMRLVAEFSASVTRTWCFRGAQDPRVPVTSTDATGTACHVGLQEESRHYVSADIVVGLTFRAVANAELFACPQDGAVALTLCDGPQAPKRASCA
jgi:hypothetical protein